MTVSPENLAVATRLRNAREFLNLPLEMVSARLGISAGRLASLESGERTPTADEMDRFARLYRLSIAFIRTGRDDAGVGAATEQALLRAQGELTARESENVQRFALFLQKFRRQ